MGARGRVGAVLQVTLRMQATRTRHTGAARKGVHVGGWGGGREGRGGRRALCGRAQLTHARPTHTPSVHTQPAHPTRTHVVVPQGRQADEAAHSGAPGQHSDRLHLGQRNGGGCGRRGSHHRGRHTHHLHSELQGRHVRESIHGLHKQQASSTARAQRAGQSSACVRNEYNAQRRTRQCGAVTGQRQRCCAVLCMPLEGQRCDAAQHDTVHGTRRAHGGGQRRGRAAWGSATGHTS